MNRRSFLVGALCLAAGIHHTKVCPSPRAAVASQGGALELGIVRDSVLTAVNDYQVFAESFDSTRLADVSRFAGDRLHPGLPDNKRREHGN